MTPLIHRIMVVRDNLDRIERADKANALDESTYQLLSGLMQTFQHRLDNVREFVPPVKADA